MARTISITTQKGGAGKTTITTIVSTIIHNYVKLKVAVIDADFQKSLSFLRHLEAKKIPEPQKKDLYPIISVDMNSVKETLSNIEDDYDLIFIDLPGSLEVEGIGTVLSQIDHIFTPIYPDNINVRSALSFINAIDDKFIKSDKAKTKSIYSFFNRYSKHKNKFYFSKLKETLSQNNYNLMQSKILESVVFDRGFRSTIKPLPVGNESTEHFFDFVKELLKIIKLYDK